MNKTLIQNVIAGVFASAVAAACGGDSTGTNAKMLADGEACNPAWSSTAVYTAGMTVSYAGRNYTAAFWTQNQVPSTNSGPTGSGQPWIPGYTCGATPTPSPTPAPTPVPTPAPPTPTPAPTPTPTDGGCGLCPTPTPGPPTPAPTTILSGSIYNIVNPNSGLDLNVVNAGMTDGTNVNIAAAIGTQQQQWQVFSNGDGTYRLTNVDRVLNVDGGGTASGTNVNIFSNNNSPAQKWQLNRNDDGTYTVINPNSGKALEVAGSGTADGTNVDIGASTGTPGQKWKFNLAFKYAQKADPDFGPNVIIFDPMMSTATIQAKLDATFSQQEKNQFGANRYAFLFKPGAYNVTVKTGFYTQVAGLGNMPDDVTINGTVQTDAAWNQGNASQNFWRSVENMSVVPAGGTEKWAVAKGAPFRRMHVKGNLALDDGGKSNGGFMADTVVDGQVKAGQQPQWFTRNGKIGSWTGSNWNMVFGNTLGAPSGTTWPTPPNTVVTQMPPVQDKPFLHISTLDNSYYIFVPSPVYDPQGPSWSGINTASGRNIFPDQIYIAKAGTDTAATINAALANHLNVIFTPGIYHLNDTIRVTGVNTVLLGLGEATLVPDNGIIAVSVADVQGVRIAGLIFEAGTVNSPTLLEVGPTGSSADNSLAPTALNDLSFRVGGAAAGKVTVALKINSNNVIGDNIWLWRADHGTGIGWTTNTATNGLIVNGNDVTMFGLAAEHFQKNQVVWNGQRGKVYSYQSELPTDVPSQSSWMNGTANGYAAYKVANTVTAHEAYGLGIDINSAISSIKLANAIEIPSAGLNGLMMHNMTTVSVGGMGTITHVLNGYGGTANATTSVVRLKQ